MNYSELQDALLMVVYLLRDENGQAKISDVVAQLTKRGLMNTFADDNMSFKEILFSEEMQKMFNYQSNPEVTSESADNTDASASSEPSELQAETDKIDEDATSEEGMPTFFKRYISFTEEGLEEAERLNRAKYSNPQSLFTWGFMTNFDSKLKDLADMAMPENWSEPDHPLVILRAYIASTFKRLLHMKRGGNQDAIMETEKWAAFNTGLVDKLYDPIFALFSLNRKPGMQKWVFHSWCTPGNHRPGQILSRFFDRLPAKATYFDKPSDIFYDINSGVPTLPFGHILERINRIPLHFLKTVAPPAFEWPEGEFTADDEFFDKLRAAFDADDYACLRLKDALELSLRRAIKKVAWNYRLVIPVYDTKRRKMMLLIPMSLDFVNNDHTDIVLMVERASFSGKYIGHTIITPAMAYRKARMVMSPTADWLSPSLLDEECETTGVHYDEDSELQKEITTSDADADAALAAIKAQRDAEEKTYVEAVDTPAEPAKDDVEIYRPEGNITGKLNVLGTIDVSAYDKSFLYRPQEQQSAETKPASTYTNTYREEKEVLPETEETLSEILATRDYDIPGIYKHNYGKPYILVGIYRYQAREFTDDDIYDEDDVLFDMRSEPNRKNTGTFHYAVNIRHAD